MEIWKTIEDIPRYEVSNECRVRNRRSGRIMKNSTFYGRPRMVVSYQGERVTLRVDQLVEEYFGVSDEEWRIVGEARNYEVSDFGRVRNRLSGRILQATLNSNGRPHVVLMDAGYRVGRNVDVLVQRAFG